MISAPVEVAVIFDAVLLAMILLRERDHGKTLRTAPVLALFFVSGFPAMIYQIVWQRALFVAYGINVQSVAVVVSAFMLGLGCGSLLGGKLSELYPDSGLVLFGASELLVALFGIRSLEIFHWVAHYTAGKTLPTTIACSLILLIVPTVLMGATLPLLVEHLVTSHNSVGHSVATLYFVNTLGSAVACFVCATVLMRARGQSGSIRFAALLNGAVGVLALIVAFASKRFRRDSVVELNATGESRPAIGIRAASLVAGLSGFWALGFEILWFRTIAVATSDRAPAFALLLATYLAGIAAGAFIGEDITHRDRRNPLKVAGAALVLAGTFSIYLAPLMAFIAKHGRPPLLSAPAYALASAFLGCVLPLLCQASISQGTSAGRNVSIVYVSNIIGSALGSLALGFVVADIMGLAGMSLVLALGTALTGVGLLSAGGKATIFRSRQTAGFLVAGFAAIFFAPATYPSVYARLQFHTHVADPENAQKYLKENRNGVILVTANDALFNGGVYDSFYNIDPNADKNDIIRAYALGLLHHNPRRVLMIGLASGSWAQVLANHPAVERFDIVEINPGYIPLIEKYPAIRSVLRNPKVHITIDDGRRWLLAHPGEKYDVIVANTTWFWRDHSSQLLSGEYLRIIKAHLLAGGVYFYNTTGSYAVYATGLHEFKYGLRVLHFLAVSDDPFELRPGEWIASLRQYRIDGGTVFNETTLARYRAFAASSNFPGVAYGLEYGENLSKRIGPQPLITDDNMGDEWRWNLD